MDVKERFLNYVSCWTTSCEGQDVIPSTERQFELARILKNEMVQMGLSDVICDEHCYVYGRLPATPGYEQKRPMGFIAHVDTAPVFSGNCVKPSLIEQYDGGDVILGTNKEVLKVKDFPRLKTRAGQTLIVTDGTTLLGADDKAGIAEILTAMEEIIENSLPHGELWIGFTPDEEVGVGSHLFDLDYFKAAYAYTVDGDYEGEIAYENFNAASAHFLIRGVNVHPGSAKNIMVNAASIACSIHALLPEMEAPEHTEDREGFYHLDYIRGDVNEAELSYLVRDHDWDLFQQKLSFLKTMEQKMNQKYGSGTVQLEIKENYRNMLEIIKENFFIVENAKAAMLAVGLEPLSRPVRGGTDGSQLSFRGLPCPNLGTGGDGFHGPYEHITVEAMETVVRIITEIAMHPSDL